MGNICSIFTIHYLNRQYTTSISIDYYRPISVVLDNGNIEEYYNYSPIEEHSSPSCPKTS